MEIFGEFKNKPTRITVLCFGKQELVEHDSAKEKSLIDISRQQTIKNDIYSFLLQKREETELSYASAVADSRVIESAIANPSPVKPKGNMIYLIGLVGVLD